MFGRLLVALVLMPQLAVAHFFYFDPGGLTLVFWLVLLAATPSFVPFERVVTNHKRAYG